MKKILAVVIAAAALTGCTKTYYQGSARYVQSNDECIYDFKQSGNVRDRKFNESKHIHYKESLCRDVLASDMNYTPVRPMPAPAPVVRPVVYQQPVAYQQPMVIRQNPVMSSANRYYTGREVEIIIE